MPKTTSSTRKGRKSTSPAQAKKTASKPASKKTTGKPASNGRKPHLPRVAKITQTGKITTWQVDGSYIRTHMDEEFTNYGHHFSYEYIPKGEFWIDQGTTPEEQKFYIDHMKVEYRLMSEGKSYDEAREKAGDVEEKERRQAGDIRKLTRGGKELPDPAQVHSRLWKKLGNGISVWIVNGRLVRSVFDDEFTSGGHEHVYEFIPENEVWIDSTLKAAERPYALVHELHERRLMHDGKEYDSAHAESSKLEKYCRQHPDQLHDKLAQEGWE